MTSSKRRRREVNGMRAKDGDADWFACTQDSMMMYDKDDTDSACMCLNSATDNGVRYDSYTCGVEVFNQLE